MTLVFTIKFVSGLFYIRHTCTMCMVEEACYVVIGVGEVGCGTHTRSTSTTQDAHTRGPADAGWRLTDSARPGRDCSAPRGGRTNYLSLHVNHRPTVFLCLLRICCSFHTVYWYELGNVPQVMKLHRLYFIYCLLHRRD